MNRATRWSFCVVAMALAVLAVVSRLGVLKAPLGLADRYEPLARAVCAARNLEIRGFLASGGLPVVPPLPVSVEEGLATTDPPLLPWAILAIHRATGLDFAVGGRVAEVLFLWLAALSVAAIAGRRTGAFGALAAGVFIVLAPPVTLACGSSQVASLAAACLLYQYVDAFVLGGGGLALAGAVVAGCAGALSDYRFVYDAAAVAAVPLFLRRGERGLASWLALWWPLACTVGTMAAVERLAGTFTQLRELQFWNPPWPAAMARLQPGARAGELLFTAIKDLVPLTAIVGLAGFVAGVLREGRASAAPVAALAAAAASVVIGPGAVAADPSLLWRLAIPVALGCGAVVGGVYAHWKAGGALLAGALVVLLYADLRPGPPPGATQLHQIGEAAKSHVAFGEAFGAIEGQSAALMAASARPALAGMNTKEKVESYLFWHGAGIRPSRWFFLLDPAVESVSAPEGIRRIVSGLLGDRYEMDKGGDWQQFDLSRPQGPREYDEPTPLLFGADYDYKSRALQFWADDTSVASVWRVEAGGASLETVHRAVVDASMPLMAMPPSLLSLEKVYVRAVAVGEGERPGPQYREICVRTKTLRKIRSRTLALVPAASLLMLAVVGAAWWVRKRG